MQKVTLDEIVGIERYEQMRDDSRRRIIELKKHRRVTVLSPETRRALASDL